MVLAYSGGLDTSCLIRWLKDKGWNVIAFMADVGQKSDFKAIEKRALKTGASKVYIIDLKEEFVKDYVFPALAANAVYEGKYFLATALSRPLIAKHQVWVAKKEKAAAVAHGSTGKGNDQVRFEVTAKILAPHLELLAPLRTWEFKTREQEIEYAHKHKIPIDVTKKSPYSIDINLYGRSIECGCLEDPWRDPPEEIYVMTKNPLTCGNRPEYVQIEFAQGVPVKVNGKALKAVDLVMKLNEIGGRNGVGRVDMVENRLVGIKSREIYENPAGAILMTAHKELEALVLDRETLHYKESVSSRYAQLTYYGLWETPLRQALDAFVQKTQERVIGIVRLKLFKGSCQVVGRKSPYSRYKEELATYTDKDIFDPKLSEGFIRIWGMPY